MRLAGLGDPLRLEGLGDLMRLVGLGDPMKLAQPKKGANISLTSWHYF